MGRVIVIGSTNTDLVVHCAKLPGAGETVLGGDLLTFAGGKGANQAVAAARAGAKVQFIGAFGDDAFGRARREDLENEGINCSCCVVKPNVHSGVALIGIGEAHGKAKAENLIIVAPGANARLTPADVRRALPKDLSDEDVVLASLEVPLESIEAGFRFAAQRGALTLLNPAPCPSNGLPASLLKWAAAVTPNETEAATLLKTDLHSHRGQQKMLRLMDQGCANFIVTQGAQGVRHYYSWYQTPKQAYTGKRASDMVLLRHDASGKVQISGPLGPAKLGVNAVAAPKVKAVDTVGAGDCFNGCLAAWLAEHAYDFENALRFAVAAAALKVTRHGAQAGMPRRNEILTLLRKPK